MRPSSTRSTLPPTSLPTIDVLLTSWLLRQEWMRPARPRRRCSGSRCSDTGSTRRRCGSRPSWATGCLAGRRTTTSRNRACRSRTGSCGTRGSPAGSDGLPVEDDGAGTADPVLAAEMRAGQLQVLTDGVGEGAPGLDPQLAVDAIHAQCDLDRVGHLAPFALAA